MHHKGYDTSKIIPQLKEIFDESVPLNFELEQEQKNRADGTPHKKHWNFVGYHNYLGKFKDGEKDYFVRFTVPEEKTRKKDYIAKSLHSTFISDIKIYEADQSVSAPKIIPRGERETVDFDAKLASILAKIKSDLKNISKVVDKNGEPLVVYHGTNWDGWEFDTENGAFFSEKEDYAEEMAAQRGGSRIVKAYLSIRNPLVVKVPGNKMADPAFEARIIAEAKSKGHDGVKLETDTNNEIEKDVFWVAFEPNQIKSATDNVGTFDPGNHDVRFSVAPDDAFVKAWAKVLLPVVSTQYINVDGAAAYLMDHGIEVYAGRDDDTLRKACVLAQTWKKERNKVVRGNREHKALEKKDPYYKILSGKFGRDFQINAGPKYDGTVFTGTWIDKHKTEKGRSGSITAAEAAKILTESTGKEVTEAVVVEHFGHLKRETLLQEYREKRRKKNELWEIEQELLEEERQQATRDIPLGDVPMPQETQAMAEARKRFVKERAAESFQTVHSEEILFVIR